MNVRKVGCNRRNPTTISPSALGGFRTFSAHANSPLPDHGSGHSAKITPPNHSCLHGGRPPSFRSTPYREPVSAEMQIYRALQPAASYYTFWPYGTFKLAAMSGYPELRRYDPSPTKCNLKTSLLPFGLRALTSATIHLKFDSSRKKPDTRQPCLSFI